MNRNLFRSWFLKLGKAWEEKDSRAIPSLFAEKFEYHETPFEKPYTSKEDILKLWQDVPDSQKDIKFNFDIIAISNNIAITHWHTSFTRTKQSKKAILDGVFLVKLNNKGLCTLFKQWWVAKE